MRSVILMLSALALLSGCCTRSAVGGLGDGTDNLPPTTKSPLDDVNFAFDSSKLDANAKAILDKNAQWIKANAGKKVTVEGHCDERGTNEYNMALGERRARSAYDYLRSLGIAADVMNTISYGEELPLDPGHNEAAWSKNRRAHFAVK